MKILFLAPQPFFQERGTPIAIDLMLSSLADRGDRVDVLTFHLGEDRHYRDVQIVRIDPPFAPANINPGFSWKKVYCDMFLTWRAFKAVRGGDYDLVHAVEEGVYIAMLLNAVFRIPYVYDMDSSMAAQLLYRYRWLAPFRRPMRYLETLAMRRAMAVVPMCESLAERARQHCRGIVQVVSDASLIPSGPVQVAEDLRSLLDTRGPIVMYVGNLERYQGIDLLLDVFAEVQKTRPDAELVIIGGTPSDIDKYRRKARSIGIARQVHLLGPRPIAALGGYLKQADLLVSPRIQGDNTPLKIYSYLDSGVAVLATDVAAHTQLVTPKEVALAAPEAKPMAAAVLRLLDDPLQRQQLARSAQAFIGSEHTLELFCKDVDRVFGELEAKVIGGS